MRLYLGTMHKRCLRGRFLESLKRRFTKYCYLVKLGKKGRGGEDIGVRDYVFNGW